MVYVVSRRRAVFGFYTGDSQKTTTKKKKKFTIPYYLFAASSESVRKAASPLSPCRRKRPYVVKIILVKIVAPSRSSMHPRVPVSVGGAETADGKTTADSEG